jgi:hypothetical protein
MKFSLLLGKRRFIMKVNTVTLCTLVTPVLLLAQSLPMRWAPYDLDTNFEMARSVYAADLDNDGDNDILGAAFGLDEIAWWENDGNGLFSTKQSISNTFYGAQCVRAADINNDGHIDVLGAAYYADDIAWWQNDGASPPNFDKHLIATGFNGAVQVEAIDLDNDNDIDVIATGGNDQSPTWWENTGFGSFVEHAIQRSGGILEFSLGDLNGDGDIDIVGTSIDDDAVFWFENDGASPPNFIEHFLCTVSGSDPYPNDMSDIDGDGDMDIVLGYGQKLAWMERRTDIISQDDQLVFDHHTICYQMQLTATSIIVTDLDDDQDKDILVTYGSDSKGGEVGGIDENNISWWEHVGERNFTVHTIAQNYCGAGSGYAACINNDRWQDVLAVSNSLDRITCWKNNPITGYKPVPEPVPRSSTEEESNNTSNIVLTSAPIHSRGTVNFSLTLNTATHVDLVIYDALGRKTETLASQSFSPGAYHISNKNTLPPGIYFLNVTTDRQKHITQKFVVVQ